MKLQLWRNQETGWILATRAGPRQQRVTADSPYMLSKRLLEDDERVIRQAAQWAIQKLS